MQKLSIDRESDAAIHDGLTRLIEVSTYLDFPFTLEEAANYFLPMANLTPIKLRSLLAESEFSDLNIMLKDEYILTGSETSIISRGERERISAAKLGSATQFAQLLTRVVPFIRTVAVTGSVAYGSAEMWDDIDLFVITARNRLWISTFLMLIQIRLYKMLGLRERNLLPFCLSYIHDEEGFSNESRKNRASSLFARELLKAKPVAGVQVYRKILQDNDWVEEYFSASYREKLATMSKESESNSNCGNSTLRDFLMNWAEGIAYELLSRYLRLRAYLTNLRLESEGKELRAFEPVISEASCVYTSNFYRWLNALWDR